MLNKIIALLNIIIQNLEINQKNHSFVNNSSNSSLSSSLTVSNFNDSKYLYCISTLVNC